MKWSLKVGRIFGIDFYLHFTFLLLLVFLGAVTWQETGAFGAALAGLGFVLALFACVLLHELGHALMARRFGIRTSDITLLPIGGIARLERMPEKPMQEFWVALAGPATNLAIAGLIFLWLSIPNGFIAQTSFTLMSGSIAQRLIGFNLILAVFNLLPAFPMDGGRILRAALSLRLGRRRATAFAANLGQFLAIGLGLLGFFYNPFLVFIAIFVYLGAQAEAGLVEMQSALGGLRVRDAMMTRFRTLSPSDSIAAVVEEFLSGAQEDFPVVKEGRVVGMLRRNDLVKALANEHRDLEVGDAMRSSGESVNETATLVQTIGMMKAQGCSSFSVTGRGLNPAVHCWAASSASTGRKSRGTSYSASAAGSLASSRSCRRRSSRVRAEARSHNPSSSS